MRGRIAIRAGIAALAAVGVTAALAAPGGAAVSTNLIKNPGAEAGAGATNTTDVVAVPHWALSNGTHLTAVAYGASGGFPAPGDPGLPTKPGKNFFAGGPYENNTSEVAVQVISLKPYLTDIQAGGVHFHASAWLGGYTTQDDNAEVEIDWKHGTSVVGSSVVLGPVTEADRDGNTEFLQRSASGKVPKRANRAYVQIIMNPVSGGYTDGYADNLSLTLGS